MNTLNVVIDSTTEQWHSWKQIHLLAFKQKPEPQKRRLKTKKSHKSNVICLTLGGFHVVSFDG